MVLKWIKNCYMKEKNSFIKLYIKTGIYTSIIMTPMIIIIVFIIYVFYGIDKFMSNLPLFFSSIILIGLIGVQNPVTSCHVFR